jgi:cell wall-associated NlpC family hydrolase
MTVRRIVLLAAAFRLLAAPLPALSDTTYMVEKGDTLSKIAGEFHVSVGKLKKANRLRSNRIAAGTPLRIPDGSAAAAGSSERPPAGPAQLHTVRTELPEPAPSGQPACPTEEDLREAARPQPPAATDNAVEPLQARMIRVAKKMLSIPYRWGGATLRGIDCSAYVRKVYGFLNLELPRSAREQFQVGEQVEKGDLSIGDLVFFRTYAKYPSHVGIYLGDNRFIHASSRSREVKISSLDHPYYEKRYIGAKRLLFGENDVRN